MPLAAQSEFCDNLSITQFILDDNTPDQWLISIAFDEETSVFIGYPVIDAMFDTNGDTIATGSLFFFGQLGGITQDYPVTPVPGAELTSFSITFSFLNGDVAESCTLQYNLPITVAEPTPNAVLTAYPNPTSHQLHLAFPSASEGTRYACINALGQTIFSGTLSPIASNALPTARADQNDRHVIALDTQHWPNGVYYIVLDDGTSEPLRVIKQDLH